ncbi:PTS sugar transporter [Brachybacterium sp. P6-10-X1]|uniref:PTS sugar transporter subunit IIA n=1 Tax=Brachybacterium sp. P6-10-X1 TaxID=1903186 RepID=UPI0009718B65|nr:PTS sugar transporter subunit IIA [Brachybacterium sp. P6-10-X1]APX33178.1 PTS sugar transporter [Brachybacterium sp. P6-10-X1]
MSELTDLLDPAAIHLDAPATDRSEAIRRSGDLLVATGAIDAAYIDAMLRTVEEHGPYIVITPGFALAHARPDASVHRTALSFLRLAEPVVFGHEANDPVQLVMTLAAADDSAHRTALAALAGVLADPERRRALDTASSPQEVLEVLGDDDRAPAVGAADTAHPAGTADTADASGAAAAAASANPAGSAGASGSSDAAGAAISSDPEAIPSKNLLLTVCGNGLGTSLFLKNTAEQVLDHWGWSSYLSIEATDTISAKGKAKDADLILTSGAIAQTLGEVGVPVEVIENFSSQAEIDAALRRRYAI